jgi:synaptobrevin family protein YKT6
VGHVYANNEGLVGVLLTDKEYPLRVAFSVIHKTMDDFLSQCPKSQWKENMGFSPLQSYLMKYQDPQQADGILKVQKELDETKVILVNYYLSLSLFQTHYNIVTLYV